MFRSKGKLCKTWIFILIGMLLITAGTCIWYVNDYYPSEITIQDYTQKNSAVQLAKIENGLFLDGGGADSAIIFYPGAKVEYIAYLPLFYELAVRGVDCFLLKMPGNLAILDMDKADDIMKAYDYEGWYLAGHSLGGAMAASYASGNLEKLKGIVLLAAYPTVSLQSDDFSVLSLYGSEDMVLNQEKLAEGRTYMPEEYTEVEIIGGNHAWFGNYGEQEGDGQALITREEQQAQTIEAILELVEGSMVQEAENN